MTQLIAEPVGLEHRVAAVLLRALLARNTATRGPTPRSPARDQDRLSAVTQRAAAITTSLAAGSGRHHAAGRFEGPT